MNRRADLLKEMGLAPVWRLRSATPEAAAEPIPVAAPSSSASEIAAMDWDQLKAKVRDCRDCKLRAGCTQTVFGVGDEQADWMMVGEAPGQEEDRLGEPFVGQAGRLLDNMLA